jgi:hypothetical protein
MSANANPSPIPSKRLRCGALVLSLHGPSVLLNCRYALDFQERSPGSRKSTGSTDVSIVTRSFREADHT